MIVTGEVCHDGHITRHLTPSSSTRSDLYHFKIASALEKTAPASGPEAGFSFRVPLQKDYIKGYFKLPRGWEWSKTQQGDVDTTELFDDASQTNTIAMHKKCGISKPSKLPYFSKNAGPFSDRQIDATQD